MLHSGKARANYDARKQQLAAALRKHEVATDLNFDPAADPRHVAFMKAKQAHKDVITHRF